MTIRNIVILMLVFMLAICFLVTTPVLAECDGDGDKYQEPNDQKDRGDKDKDRDPDGTPVGWLVDRPNPRR